MKILVTILFAVCALAAANNEFPEYDNLDWSKIVPVQDMRKNIFKLLSLYDTK